MVLLENDVARHDPNYIGNWGNRHHINIEAEENVRLWE